MKAVAWVEQFEHSAPGEQGKTSLLRKPSALNGPPLVEL